MDRYWLLSSTFYGNRLPGDPRGFVSRVRDVRPEELVQSRPTSESGKESRREHDIPGTPCDADFPGLHRHALSQLKGQVIRVTREQADALVPQFRETAAHRGWQLLAVAVMEDHIHIVVGVAGDPNPEKTLGDFKAYGSRPLTRKWGKPPNGTWWTYDGSKRKLTNARAVRDAIIRARPAGRFGSVVVVGGSDYFGRSHHGSVTNGTASPVARKSGLSDWSYTPGAHATGLAHANVTFESPSGACSETASPVA